MVQMGLGTRTPAYQCCSQHLSMPPTKKQNRTNRGGRETETRTERHRGTEIDFKGSAHASGRSELSRTGPGAGCSSRIAMFQY